MNSNAGSVFARISKRTKVYVGGVAVVTAATFACTGFMHMNLAARADASPMVSTAPALSDNTIAPLLALDRATEAVAERIEPSVVTINVYGETKVAGGMGMQGMNPKDLPAPFQQFFQGPWQQQQQQPQVQQFGAAGTGVIISPDGYIVTNNHVVKDAKNVQVYLQNQKEYDAKVVGADAATDLAVLKINATGLTSAEFGDSSQLHAGQTVLAIGDPLNMQFSVTRGIISALNRPRQDPNNANVITSRGTFIQTDAPINHGNSGGPLVDAEGEVIGINSEILSSSGGSMGIGFAIPSNLVKSTAAELIKHGKVLRGYLGIDVTDLTPSVADSLNEAGIQGALVNSVTAGSPAQHAGLKPYDVVTVVDGQKVTTGSDLSTITGGIEPGNTAHLSVMRDGKPLSFAVVLGDYANQSPNPAAADNNSSANGNSTPKLGVTVEGLTPEVRSQLQLPDSVHGVVVDSVDPGSPAMLAGIGRGDVIEQINQHAVTTPDELKHQLSLTPAGKNVLLMVHEQNGDFILTVHPN